MDAFKPTFARNQVFFEAAWNNSTGNSGWQAAGTAAPAATAAMGYDPKARVGVVVLTNFSTDAGVDDIGRHLLNSSYPLLNIPPPVEHIQITLDTRTFDRYVGIYQVAPDALLTVSRDGDRFYSRITGQPKLEVLAESHRKFFLKAVDAELTFDTDSKGTVTQVTLHQNGRDLVAKLLSEAEVNKVQNSEAAKRFKTQTQCCGLFFYSAIRMRDILRPANGRIDRE